MTTSKKLEVIYYDGKPDGIRSVRRYLSTITTYIIPRPLLNEAKKITGINNPGIYYLISENDDNKLAKIYVGQTRNGIERIDDHNRSKDFWNKAIMFLADTKTFSLDMISALELYAISKARESKRYDVENIVVPKYKIDEYDLPYIEEIYEEIKFMMATQGYSLENADETISNSNILHTSRNGIKAIGVYDGEKFEILSGSEINMDKAPNLEKYNKHRKELFDSGNIVLNEKGKYILNITLEFKSPSGASDFVLGGSTNGWTEWKDKNGKTLDQLYRTK